MPDVLSDIPVNFDSAALRQRCHVATDSDDAVALEALVDQARALARPKALYREAFIEERGDDTVRIAGVTFTSRALRANLDGVERVFAYVATCGAELDAIRCHADDILQPFWLDAIKSVALAAAKAHLAKHLTRTYALGRTASMNPGAAEASVWPIEQQKQLWRLLGDVEGLVGVRLTESCLMVPTKSVSGLRFPTRIDFQSCQLCRREMCPSRSAPFDPRAWAKVSSPNGSTSPR